MSLVPGSIDSRYTSCLNNECIDRSFFLSLIAVKKMARMVTSPDSLLSAMTLFGRQRSP